MIGRRSVVNGFVSERILKGGFHFITPDNRQSGHGPKFDISKSAGTEDLSDALQRTNVGPERSNQSRCPS